MTTAFRQLARATAPQRRIVGFAHSGGNATSFAAWPACLPAGWELWAGELPGHGARAAEPLARDVASVVGPLASELAPLLDVPVILYGHSLGAVIAYEIAHALAGHAPRLAALVVTARAPAPLAGPAWHRLDDAALVERIAALAGPHRGDRELLERVLPTLRADFEMAERWQPAERPPLDVPILAIAGLSDPHATPRDLDGWARHTRARFRRYAFPGDHFFPELTLHTMIQLVGAFVDEETA